MMPRAEFSKQAKLAAFRRAMGRCEGCSGLLVPGKFCSTTTATRPHSRATTAWRIASALHRMPQH